MALAQVGFKSQLLKDELWDVRFEKFKLFIRCIAIVWHYLKLVMQDTEIRRVGCHDFSSRVRPCRQVSSCFLDCDQRI